MLFLVLFLQHFAFWKSKEPSQLIQRYTNHLTERLFYPTIVGLIAAYKL